MNSRSYPSRFIIVALLLCTGAPVASVHAEGRIVAASTKAKKKKKNSTPPQPRTPSISNGSSNRSGMGSSSTSNLGSNRNASGTLTHSVVPIQSSGIQRDEGSVQSSTLNFKFLQFTVASGVTQATLELWTGKGWKPLETRHLNGTSQTITFARPANTSEEQLRVRTSTNRKFTFAQLAGETDFWWSDGGGVLRSAGPTISSGHLVLTDTSGIVGTLTGTTALATTNNVTATSNSTTTSSSSTTTSTQPVESDIWKVVGSRLFFFNQYRGLQVFDLSHPEQPTLTGSLHMAAKGEFFYPLDDTGSRLALITRNSWRHTDEGYSAIKLVTVSSNGVPSLASTIPVSGYMGEGRLIGSRLYIVETAWRTATGGVVTSAYWNDFRIHGFDLTDEKAPVDLGSAAGTGYAPVIQATNDYLMASTSAWRWDSTYHGSFSKVHVFSFDSDGRPRLAKVFSPKGTANDQFKFDIRDHYLLTATQRPSWAEYATYQRTRVDNQNGTDTITISWGWKWIPSQTWVETFDINDTKSDNAVAQLNIDAAQGESLHATRFDGKRLYVVTFGVRQEESVHEYYFTETIPHGACDPLFIVDISDPTKPTLHGQLQIPGWSNFIYPNGDRLLAVGREGQSIAVSYYDVSDADAPKELARVYPGGKNTSYWSWSEADYDHRAVTFEREKGKAFVPFQQWSNTGYQSAMQTIDVASDTLTLGPVIQQNGTARRGASVNGCLVSISGRQLKVVSDPPAPEVSKEVASLELSWPVERVVQVGNYLMQIESGVNNGWWGYLNTATNETVVRLTTRDNPDYILDSVSLAKGEIICAEKHNADVVLAQRPADGSGIELRTWVLRAQDGKIVQVANLDITSPPAITSTSVNTLSSTAAASSIASIRLSYWGNLSYEPDWSSTQALWANDQTLVWYVPYHQQWRWMPVFDTLVTHATIVKSSNSVATLQTGAVSPTIAAAPPPAIAEPAPTEQACALLFPVYRSNEGNFTAGERLTVTTKSSDDCIETSPAFGGGGAVWFSSRLNGIDDGSIVQPIGIIMFDAPNASAPGGHKLKRGEQKCALHVVDFSSGAPVTRDPTPLPGTLIGVHGADVDGAWLITQRWKTKDDGSSSSQWLQSLAYDGMQAHKMDEFDMGSSGYSAMTTASNRVFTANSTYLGYDPTSYNSLYDSTVREFRVNAATGKIQELQSWSSGSLYVSDLRVVNDVLLASGWGQLSAARINANDTLSPWAPLEFGDYVYPSLSRAVLDENGATLWMPSGDYGVEPLDLK